MDPFTEKLLERTRARRENLQKKMAERPNAANRLMVKRPLADTNSVITEPIVDKVPQVSSKPSPSKRKCSEENIQPAAGEQNQEPMMTRPSAPNASDPPTDKKPPVGPASIRSSSSLEKTATRPAVQSEPQQLRTAQPEPGKMVVTPAPEPPCSTEMETADVRKENLVEQQTPSAAGMKSRLQRLMAQRKCWEDDDTADALPDYTPLSVLERQADVPPTQVHTTTAFSSETPVGRRGRLANLAATIGSWEDDLSHAHVPSAKDEPSKAFPKAAGRAAAAGSSAASGKLVSSQQAECSPVKSSRNFPPSLQKSDIPAARPALNKPGSSPQKSSIHATAFPSSPQKPEPSSSVIVPQSPLKNQILSRGPNPSFSPQKPEPSSSVTVPQSPLKNQNLSRGPNPSFSPQKPEICAKPTTVSVGAPQEKAGSGAPSVKSFLERFGERCQERTNQNSPAGGITHIKTPSVTPSAVTPNSRVVQERFRAAQATNTTTADLTQRQKLERESELAQIRSRFQKGNNVWKHKEKEETNKITDIKEPLQKPLEAEAASVESQDEPTPPSAQSTDTPRKCPPPGVGLMVSPPALTSSPLKTVVDAKDQMTDATPEEVEEREMNVDESVNSAVINELFDGILEQSEDQKDDDEEEEEDALNISSMSLLTPLAETVAAVVKSPERRMMTSTPASSFLIKSNTPESVTTANKLQRANMGQSASFDSIDASDEDHKLPYSIDAYRSTRVKEPERPSVKQVIVRNENVCQRAEEPRGSSLFSLKQKMKVLNGEMNLQQTVIHQASQALNCCTDEEHGKGSQVEAEAERLLLIATERREALMAELDRLKGELSGQKKTPAPLDYPNMSASKGSVTLQELRLPLKADFVCSTANRPEATKYSFFILIRAGAENTVATPLASTHCGLNGDTLTFPTKFTLSDVSSNFDIDIEVYGLVQKRDACSDKKKKPSKSKIMWRQVYEAHDLCMSAITPKRFLAITKTVQTPVMASPGGPNAVRTSNFILVGSHKLTLTSIGKNKFPLEKIRYEGELLSDMFHTKVPYLCPLEGHVYLKMQCEVGSKVEGRGFLTMFEDVSGFGAWHRRWCVLSGYCISYWTYPDDEKRKNPIGRINLANCTSKKVEPVNREFCARPNTLELITVRPQRDDDKETLVTQCQNTMCVTKNWLSADTKDERNLWMNKLNQILVDLRMWKPDSCYRPQ